MDYQNAARLGWSGRDWGSESLRGGTLSVWVSAQVSVGAVDVTSGGHLHVRGGPIERRGRQQSILDCCSRFVRRRPDDIRFVAIIRLET